MLARHTAFALSLTLVLVACGDDDDGGESGVDAGSGFTDGGVRLDGGAGGGDGSAGGSDGATGSGAIGAGCASGADCASGQCETNLFGLLPLPGGYCSQACSPTTACPGDAVCVAQANVCAAPCTDNSDCRMAEGYMCTPVPGAGSICIPPVQIPDGGITFPDGGFGLPDGGFMLPEGGIGFPDGGIIFPDGGFGLPDGSFPGL